MSTVFMLIGLLIGLVGTIWFLVIAFKESVLWGLGCLFLPFVSLIFLIMHFGKSWRPLALHVLGIVLFIPGIFAFAEDAEKIRNEQMVPLAFEQPLSIDDQVTVLMKLKDKGIKSSITLGKVYVPKKDVERAKTILAQPEETK
jgi:hypothetical protein